MTSTPARIDSDLYEAAKAAGGRHTRSAAQQLNHWARIGREFESSPTVSHRDIDLVLAGEADYDRLGEREQAVVRAEWVERVAGRRRDLDLETEFSEAGDTWAEGDDTGGATVRGAESSPLDTRG